MINDSEVLLLASIATTMQLDYVDADDIWVGSPFAWIKTRPSRQIGAIGERIISGWLAAKGFNVLRSPDTEADRIIEKERVEIKFSTLWKNGTYTFQQIRNQNYKFVICLGISPFNAHCWVIDKNILMEQWGKTGGIQPQHGGRVGTDTAWFSVIPSFEQTWLQLCGGSLYKAVEKISELTGYYPEI